MDVLVREDTREMDTDLAVDHEPPKKAAMEVLVYEDTKEVVVDAAAVDEVLKKKRRVSFAHTQTVHFYPMNDDIETPPLLNSDPLGIKACSASELGTPRTSLNRKSDTPPFQEKSIDFSHFTSDMDTSHGSQAPDEDGSGDSPSFDGLEDGSGCFVHLRHVSRLEDDDSIVNEVFNDDMTMDATAFSRNLSQFLKSGTTFDLQGTDSSAQYMQALIDEDTQREDSMALTETGGPHWGLRNPQNVSLHADDDKSDMSLATTSDRVRQKSICMDDDKSDMSLSTMSGGPRSKSICRDGEESDSKLHTETNRVRPKRISLLTELQQSPVNVAEHIPLQKSETNRVRPKRRSLLTELKQSPVNVAEHIPLQKNISTSSEEKENCAPHKIQDMVLKHDQKITPDIKSSQVENEHMFPVPLTKLQTLSDHLEFSCSDNQAEEECMVQVPSAKLQTLNDYLEFSCSVQLQVEWLNERMKGLESKLHDAKKRNTEFQSCNTSAQAKKRVGGSSYALKTKTACYKHSLAKKGWVAWKIDAQRQILSWLQESKDNLMKEVNEAETKSKQVSQMKESYSCISSKMEFDEASLEFNETAASLAVTNKTAKLSTLHQEACDQLNHLQIRWDDLCTKIEHIKSLHNPHSENDKESFERCLKDSTRKLAFTNSLLQQQQAACLNVKQNGGNSVIELSLERMYLQSFQVKGDNSTSQVQISRSMVPEAVEMNFPCFEAPLFVQHLICSTNIETIELQKLKHTFQRSNYLMGSMLDVLKEIKFCRRNFGISCKFEIANDDPRLCVAFCENGKRVILMFSMARVCKGIYPFNENPAQINVEIFDSKETEIKTKTDVARRISRIRDGFGRLARICACVEGAISTAS